MKTFLVIFSGLAFFSAVHAQTSGDVQLMTGFHANGQPQIPDASQINYDTPPELLKASGTPQIPDPSQINYETPPELLKASGTPQIPDPSQINYETPPELLKSNKHNASPEPTAQPK